MASECSWFQDVEKKTFSKTLNEKCKALKDIEKGLSNKDASKKYGVQFRHGSKIKISISKLWKTIFPAKKRKLREWLWKTWQCCVSMVLPKKESKHSNRW